MEHSPRVLSIQSHVVSGYVGNKSATFPLQLLGFEVDPLNSVHFSNHSGYKTCPGHVLQLEDLDTVLEGLHANDLDHYTHVLTGYTRSDSFLRRVGSLVKQLKSTNPNLVYVCDPVMGDNGRMYVPENILPVYRDLVMPLADIMTPNQFEVEILTGMKVNNLEDAWKAVDILHEKGCSTVVVSSTDLGDNDSLVALGSTKKENNQERVIVKIPKLPASFTGTGDLFAALLLAWMHKTGNRLKESLEKTVSTLQAVLKRTLQHVKDQQPTSKDLELKLIQSKRDIENPAATVAAEIV